MARQVQSGSAPVDRRDKPVNGDGRYDPVGQELRHGEGGVIQPLPAPDIFIDGAPHDTRFIAGPCHGRAADWMRVSISPSAVWAGEGVVVEDVDFQDFVARAMRAGFTLALRFDVQERIIDGLALAAGRR